jgi:purine-binding chemotaxis protein CheW
MNSNPAGEAAGERDDAREVVVFLVEGIAFGIDVGRVVEITKVMEITKVPRSLPFIEGIVNLRGKIIPVVDLRKRLGFEVRQHDDASRIVIVRMDGSRLGLLVDKVTKVAKIPLDTIEEMPQTALQIDSHFIDCVGKIGDNLIILMRLSDLLTQSEKEMLGEARRRKGRETA